MAVSSDRPPTTAPGAADSPPATRLDLAGLSLLQDAALGWRGELVRPGLLGLRSVRGRAALVDAGGEQPLPWALELDAIRSGAFPARYVVVLGGDASVRAQLIAASSDLAARGLWLLHADGTGPNWQSREPRRSERRVARALVVSAERAFARTRWSVAEAAAHGRRLELDRMLARTEARDFERFRALLAQRRPRATFALMAVILGVFGLQARWGGVDLPPLLACMGSLVPERIASGEWWRFFSCTFLHGGGLHVGLNLVVLWMLGRSLERFIGSTRFIAIYFAAGLAGSASSVLFVSTQSVGASGAIWGLFGAEAALAFYPRPLLPPALIGLSRRAVAVSLALNLAISFIPHVDMAAHIGGGLMGVGVLALMAASGLLSPHGRAAPPAGGWLTGVAATLTAAFLVGLVVAIAHGRPWRLDGPPELERVALLGSPWSIEIPRGRSPLVQREGGSIEFGNLAYDPEVVDIRWAPLANDPSGHLSRDDQARNDQPRDDLAALERLLSVVPDGLEQLLPPRLVSDAARPERSLVTVRYRHASNPDLITDRAVGIVDGSRVRVDVVAWAALPRAFDGLSAHILRSFEPALALGAR